MPLPVAYDQTDLHHACAKFAPFFQQMFFGNQCLVAEVAVATYPAASRNLCDFACVRRAHHYP
ncbi:hypothetical protein PsorP6_002275 [Peronosclerospora sorghi]|uniref:Uncharacterized protein n=1 Tax=Peronosclerospora sorghi TaxID=230839 RepID=A0ACC0WW85_9STRA|nr:hypothetical protein PsorP6_002275 [Peronosclerospora sorghi]